MLHLLPAKRSPTVSAAPRHGLAAWAVPDAASAACRTQPYSRRCAAPRLAERSPTVGAAPRHGLAAWAVPDAASAARSRGGGGSRLATCPEGRGNGYAARRRTRPRPRRRGNGGPIQKHIWLCRTQCRSSGCKKTLQAIEGLEIKRLRK